VRWMAKAGERVHGTTHELPRERFERAEAAALRPLPAHHARAERRAALSQAASRTSGSHRTANRNPVAPKLLVSIDLEQR